MTRIAVLQMTSGIDPEVNFTTIEQAVIDAAKNGAEVLFTPEMSLLLDRDRRRAAPKVEGGMINAMVDRLAALSASCSIDIALGSSPVAEQGVGSDSKWKNRSFYFSQEGGTALSPSTYDKIHMFDVELANGESWKESSAYEPGDAVVAIDETPVGKLGLAVCYDLRFPALFEAFGQRQCDAIAIPAAFTFPTGEAHWHLMLRARAIEASAFVIAAAQVGTHEDGRQTYGHSLVIDPWGEVLLDMGGDDAGLEFCDLDLRRIDEVRAQLPSLANRRDIPN